MNKNMDNLDSTLSEIIEKIENKEKETRQFIKKYQARKMSDLQQYYEGANWALNYVLKTVKEVYQ